MLLGKFNIFLKKLFLTVVLLFNATFIGLLYYKILSNFLIALKSQHIIDD